MAFMRRRNPNNGKRDWKGAIEDGIVVGSVTFIGTLAGFGYPPTVQALYTSVITGLLTFFISIQRRFGIPTPQ